MYFRKLSLFHRPIRRMVESSAPESFIAIAPPERRECVPISLALKPSFVVSIEATDLRKKLILSLLVML